MEQAETAEKIGLTRDQWQNVERARTPLRYVIAFELRRRLGISLDWLAGMPTEMLSPERRMWPSPGAAACLDKALFSAVASELLANKDCGLGLYRAPDLAENFPGPTMDRAQWAVFFSTYIAQRLAMVVPDKIGELGGAMLEAVNSAAAKFETNPAIAKILFDQIQLYQQRVSRPLESKFPASDFNLTDAEGLASVPATMKVQLPSLLERLRKATAQAGKKTELAGALNPKVPLESVSRWLSGSREPSGEVALQLLRWVEMQERGAK